MDWPNVSKVTAPIDETNYLTLHTYFDTVMAPAILMGIEAIDQGKVEKTYG